MQGPQDDGYYREALGLFQATGNLSMQAYVESNLGILYAMAGRWSEAVELFRKAAASSLKIGDAVGAAEISENLGELLVKQRRYDEAEPVLQDALRVMRAAGQLQGAGPEIRLAQILIDRGQLDDADNMLSSAIEAFRHKDQRMLALEATAILTECKLRAGAPDRGLALLDAALEEAGADAEFARPVIAPYRARALASVGREAEAAAELLRSLQAAIEQHLPYEEAMIRLARVDLEKRAGRTPDPEDLGGVRRVYEQLGIVD